MFTREDLTKLAQRVFSPPRQDSKPSPAVMATPKPFQPYSNQNTAMDPFKHGRPSMPSLDLTPVQNRASSVSPMATANMKSSLSALIGQENVWDGVKRSKYEPSVPIQSTFDNRENRPPVSTSRQQMDVWGSRRDNLGLLGKDSYVNLTDNMRRSDFSVVTKGYEGIGDLKSSLMMDKPMGKSMFGSQLIPTSMKTSIVGKPLGEVNQEQVFNLPTSKFSEVPKFGIGVEGFDNLHKENQELMNYSNSILNELRNCKRAVTKLKSSKGGDSKTSDMRSSKASVTDFGQPAVRQSVIYDAPPRIQNIGPERFDFRRNSMPLPNISVNNPHQKTMNLNCDIPSYCEQVDDSISVSKSKVGAWPSVPVKELKKAPTLGNEDGFKRTNITSEYMRLEEEPLSLPREDQDKFFSFREANMGFERRDDYVSPDYPMTKNYQLTANFADLELDNIPSFENREFFKAKRFDARPTEYSYKPTPPVHEELDLTIKYQQRFEYYEDRASKAIAFEDLTN